jgi:hypothetical protein
MRIKRFNLNERYYADGTETTFMQKMEEDYDNLDIVKHVISTMMEDIEDKVTDDKDKFEELVMDNIKIDETDILNLTLEQEIDLCIYAEENNDEFKCPETSWDDLRGVISKNAVNGIGFMVDNKLRTDFLDPLEKFMEDNELEYGDIRTRESYSHSAPTRVRSIENGEIYEYRKLDGSFNVDEYVYENKELVITLYIKKVL